MLEPLGHDAQLLHRAGHQASVGESVHGVGGQSLDGGAHDRDGGLALAAFELAEASGVGLVLDSADTSFLFGEDQARYVITVEEKMAQFLANNAADAGVQFRVLGNVGGDKLVVKDVLALDVAKMKTAHENWFPDYMA